MSTKRLLFVAQLFLLAASISHATIIHIPADAASIQAGIDLAVNSDTVLVAPGTYQENIHFRGKGITVASEYLLDQDLTQIETTVIDGSNPIYPDTASCVIIATPSISTAEDTTAALIGFTITGGTGTKWTDEHGAGAIYREGGGIIVQYLSPRIHHNIIKNNRATNTQGLGMNHAGGGAIRCGDSNPLITNNVIMDNQGLYGGGIVLNYTGAVIKNNVIVHDSAGSAYGGGGAIWIWANDPLQRAKIIENNTITENLCGNGINITSGIYLAGTTATIHNNIIWANAQSQISLQSGGTATVSYCDIQGGWTPGIGNLDEEPGFSTENYYLTDESPCKDAGDPDVSYNDPEDPTDPGHALWPSLGNLRNDIGAYGGPGHSEFPDFITGIMEEGRESLPADYFLLQNYPNPFNAATTITYRVSEPGPISLKIYNLYGQEIITLLDQYQPPGMHRSSWDGRNRIGQPLGSGIYLCRLLLHNSTNEHKIILLR